MIELFQLNKYNLVLLGGGISDISEKKIRALFSRMNAEVPIIQHYGGGSGLLKSEIEVALRQVGQDRFQITDNPFA